MPVRQMCFMVMPYGEKETHAGPRAPKKVNFNALWEKAFQPVLIELDYDPVRADQEIGALIVAEMLEELWFAPLVIADVTIPNGNVYYEVGIRHAAKKDGCVLVSADWSKQLFDIQSMRQLRYPLPEGEPGDATIEGIRKVLREHVDRLAAGVSPMFEVLPGYPNPTGSGRAQAVRKHLQDLSAFQTEARAVGLAPAERRAALARELAERHGKGDRVPSIVAVEIVEVLRDNAGWQDVLSYVEGLPPHVQRLDFIREQKALALSKTGDHGRAIAELQQLIEDAGDTSERQGLIGGRYKVLWQGAKTDAERRQHLNASIKAYERGMLLDLNDYFPSSNLPRLYRERGSPGDEERARIAAAIALRATERAHRSRTSDTWVRATLLALAFDAGDASKVEELADEIEAEGPALWRVGSVMADLRTSTAQVKDADVRKVFEAVMARLEAISHAGQPS